MQQVLPLERPAVSQTNQQTKPYSKSGASLQCKDKPAPEQQKHKERYVDNETLQMLVEGMVGDSEQAIGRDQGDERHGHKEKTGCCGASNKQRPAVATNRHPTRALD